MISTEDFERVRSERDMYKKTVEELSARLKTLNADSCVHIHPVSTPSFLVFGSREDLNALSEHIAQTYQDGFKDACTPRGA